MNEDFFKAVTGVAGTVVEDDSIGSWYVWETEPLSDEIIVTPTWACRPEDRHAVRMNQDAHRFRSGVVMASIYMQDLNQMGVPSSTS